MKKLLANKKTLLTVIAGLVLIVSGVFLFRPKADLETEYEELTVKRGNVSVSLNIDGKTAILRRDLGFELGGKVAGVLVKEGDVVTQWQTLAYLDAREAQKNLEKALRDYSKERADFEQDRLVTYPNGALTTTIERILAKNQWDLEKAVLDVELETISQQQSYLVSPINGVVAKVDIAPGETVSSQASQPIITVVDENSFVFEVYAEDIEALKIQKEMPVRISLEALPDSVFEGKVLFVSPLATLDTNDLATYKVLVKFANPELTLLDAMAGTAEIISKEVKDVLKIENTAVKLVNRQPVVYFLKDNKLVEQKVKLGFTNGNEVEVVSGLKAGDKIVNW